MESDRYIVIRNRLLDLDGEISKEHFIIGSRWQSLEQDIDEGENDHLFSAEEASALRELLEDLRSEHDLRMNSGTLGS
jgi:hypothetical protein